MYYPDMGSTEEETLLFEGNFATHLNEINDAANNQLESMVNQATKMQNMYYTDNFTYLQAANNPI